MAKRIIILERSDVNTENYQYILWASVPAGVEDYYADAAFTSAYADVGVEELAALRAGTVVEQAGYTNALPGKADIPLADRLADLVTQFNEFQSRITAFDPYDQYEKYYDGEAWVEP